MQAEILSTSYISDNPQNLLCVVQFTDSSGNSFTQSYIYPVGSDPLDQINADLANYTVAETAATSSLTDIQTALEASPVDGVSVNTADPVVPDEVSNTDGGV